MREEFMARMLALVAEYRDSHPDPVLHEDAALPLGPGQVRRLDPRPGFPGQSRLVLLLDAPEEDFFYEDDGTAYPCLMLHVVLLWEGHRYAATCDLQLPRVLTGTPFELTLITDSLTTMFLPADTDPRSRFGPCLGRVLPYDVCFYAWESLHTPVSELPALLASVGVPGAALGEVSIQAGDNLWYRRCREVRNLNEITS